MLRRVCFYSFTAYCMYVCLIMYMCVLLCIAELCQILALEQPVSSPLQLRFVDVRSFLGMI